MTASQLMILSALCLVVIAYIGFRLLKSLINREYAFTEKEQAREFFTRITSLYKNLNYSREGTPEHNRYLEEIRELADQAATSG